MADVSQKKRPLSSLLVQLRHRLKLRDHLASLGITYIPGSKFLKGVLDGFSARAGEILTSCQGFKVYVDPMDVGIAQHVISDGVYEPGTTELFKSLLKPGMVVLDVGANFGYYGLIASRIVGNSGAVYAFEPEPKNFRLLNKNITLNNFSNIIPLQVALSNEAGKATLFLDKTNLGMHSVRRGNIIADGGVVEVETTTLDNFVQTKMKNGRVDLITMDVQGAEELVIAGAEQTLRKNDVKIIMEFWPHGLRNIGTDPQELIHKLREYGFSITLIDEPDPHVDLCGLAELLEKRADPGASVNLLLEKMPTGNS
ncbi:MAG: FkbM family methyltransferase [Candidatus Acidiferrales bacterium]